ncbi:YkvA family protein [Clostridium hydrogeniformans]|uniref:YkvA family protein n=1 Tax=Clostridium hydrogeniformans TaxID=349933 RepID=UPI000483F357|nr:DUF1232 domain-containing protein [Clostridium hydrogeniformans]
MKVSNVDLALSGEDLLSICKDFLKVQGLRIENIKVLENVEIKGEYKGIIKLPFYITMTLDGNLENKVYLNVKQIKAGNISLWNFIKKRVVNKIIRDLEEDGISFKEDRVTIDITSFLKKIPVYLDFTLQGLYIKDGLLRGEAKNIDFSLNKPIIDEVLIKEEEIERIEINKTKDCYTEVKGYIENKVPEKYDGLLKFALIIPDLAALLYRLLKDKRVGKKIKISVLISLVYISSPFDILPDFIPFVGKIDDVAVVFFALNKIINNVDDIVILENWEGEDDIIKIIKDGIYYLNTLSGGERVDKLYNTIDRL